MIPGNTPIVSITVKIAVTTEITAKIPTIPTTTTAAYFRNTDRDNLLYMIMSDGNHCLFTRHE